MTNEIRMARLKHLKAMNAIIKNCTSEEVYDIWTSVVPDEATMEDIVNDDGLCGETRRLFRSIISSRRTGGFNVGFRGNRDRTF